MHKDVWSTRHVLKITNQRCIGHRYTSSGAPIRMNISKNSIYCTKWITSPSVYAHSFQCLQDVGMLIFNFLLFPQAVEIRLGRNELELSFQTCTQSFPSYHNTRAICYINPHQLRLCAKRSSAFKSCMYVCWVANGTSGWSKQEEQHWTQVDIERLNSQVTLLQVGK